MSVQKRISDAPARIAQSLDSASEVAMSQIEFERARKRRLRAAGLKPICVWIPAEMKATLDQMIKQGRHGSLDQAVRDALSRVYSPETRTTT